MSKNKKYALIMLLISLVIMIMLFIPRNQQPLPSNKSEVEKVTSDNKELNKSKNETYTNLKPSDDIIVNKTIGEFTKEINNKNFSKAYSMLDKEYIKDFNVTLEFFSERYNFQNEKKFSINDINTDLQDRYIVDISFQDVNAEQYKSIVRKTFTIYKKENEKYTIAELGILDKDELNLKSEFRPSIKFTLEKIYATTEGSIAIINAENDTKTYFAIKNDRFGFFAKDEKYTYDHSMINNYSEDYMITPGIPKKFLVKFNKIQYPSYIGIYYIGVDSDNATQESEEKADLFEIK